MPFIVLLSGSIAQPFSVKKLYLKELSLMWLNSTEIIIPKESNHFSVKSLLNFPNQDQMFSLITTGPLNSPLLILSFSNLCTDD